MALQPLKGFRQFKSWHCITGSMRHIYDFYGHPVSEDLLLGLGAAVGFIYWHQKGTYPFIGGRSSRDPERMAGERTGVVVKMHTSGSARRAEQTLIAELEAGRPVMLQLDMGFLPYFDFGGHDYHFGGHVVVACGYDGETRQVLLADRDEELHPVSLEDLEKARGSTHKPFPPKRTRYSFDHSQKRVPTAAETRAAIREMCQGMLEPPISNLGAKGIRTAAKRILEWPSVLDGDELKGTLFNAFIFINERGGTGGGIFRFMLSRFLREAAGITGDDCLLPIADEFHGIAQEWDELGYWFRDISQVEDPAARLGESTAPLLQLADREQAAWGRLSEWV